jgi:prophage tail gpP-like protein
MEILLNNVDITSLVKIKGLSLKEKLNYKVDTFSFNFMLEGKSVEPKDEDEVVIKIDSIVVFSGVIDNISLSISGNKTGYMSVTACDYTRLVSKKLINNSYKNKTISQIVIDIIDNELNGYGITKGIIDDIAINLEDVLFDYRKASDVLTDLADYVLGY